MPTDVQSICRIPIGNIGEDIWAWKHDKFGNFSVRSAYKALCQQRQRSDVTTESSRVTGDSWNKLWGLQVPPKVCNFWWRVIKKFVPCRAILKERRVEQISCLFKKKKKNKYPVVWTAVERRPLHMPCLNASGHTCSGNR